ncbi:MAG: TIGR04282 family arsenosugar biosynthesis glycosyltransferase [Gemmataceae bacterium]|nr:TIGR04282 family arsenosugar biosynthesis glycosyltransferase [Gemmataceae bacterium]
MTHLGLFAKWPRAGLVKTRLATALGTPLATRIADAFLRDAVIRFHEIAERQVIVFAPDEDRELFCNLAEGSWELEPQGPGDLGERLQRFFTRCLTSVGDVVIALGTDSPTLPVEFVSRAFDMLQSHEVVLGPATDGGYYLVGLSQPRPEIFEGIAWSSADVLGQTIDRLGDARVALLPVWYDVDTPEDWQMLRGHLRAWHRAGVRIDCPHTAELAGISLL